MDAFFFQTLPYVAVALFLVGTIYRVAARPFTCSTLSSQFLESRHLFWGSVPMHLGLLALAAGHLLGLLVPRRLLLWNAVPLRVAIVEVVALAFGLLALVGLLNLVLRRLRDPRVRVVTSRLDWIVLALLLGQVVTGLYVAIFRGWGTSWYAASAVPYLRSLIALEPDISFVTPLPLPARLHVVGAWVLLGLLPFSRLVPFGLLMLFGMLLP